MSAFARTLFTILSTGVVCLAAAQGANYAVPDGPRHFVILVDSTHSMERDLTRSTHGEKRRALGRAESGLATALFHGEANLSNLPRYRPGKDLVTVVQFGIDSQSQSDRAYLRLSGASLTTDYARVALSGSNVTQEQLRQALRPTVRTNLNVLAWAVPIGLRAAAVGPDVPVQSTYVVLVYDAQLNAGSVALERDVLGRWLSDLGWRNLRLAEQAAESDVRLTNSTGVLAPLASYSFGRVPNTVTVAAYRATSVSSEAEAARLAPLDPLRNAMLSWRGGRLHVEIEPPREFVGHSATLRADISAPVMDRKTLAARTAFDLKLPSRYAGERIWLVLAPETVARNPLLGTQRIAVLYRERFEIPQGPALLRALLVFSGLLLLTGCVAGAVWIYREGWLATHFVLHLDGYGRPFALPPLSQRRTERLSVRRPRWPGSIAAQLEMPSKWVLWLLYRDAKLSWTSGLSVQGLPETATEGALIDLPQTVSFVWTERPTTSVTVRLRIERKLPIVSGHSLELAIRYAALPVSYRPLPLEPNGKPGSHVVGHPGPKEETR